MTVGVVGLGPGRETAMCWVGQAGIAIEIAGPRLLIDPYLWNSLAVKDANSRSSRGPDGAIWHSGDCVPFDGLVEEVASLAPDVALLPVNGRRPKLAAAGIMGNFTANGSN
jgi:L-ascorbate metabolism protein UlaG (beta-lactamase superfamily)